MSSLDAVDSSDLPPVWAPAAAELGPWAHKWLEPPPDITIATSPAGGRTQAAREIAQHVLSELARERSLYCIVDDRCVQARIGGFDGRALPSHCLQRAESCPHRLEEKSGASQGASR